QYRITKSISTAFMLVNKVKLRHSPGRPSRSDFVQFELRVVISDGIDDLFELPTLYRTAREALELMMDRCFHGGNVCTVAQLRTPLLLKELEGRSDLIAKEIRELAAHDKKRTHSIAKRFIII
ncbi:MAG: hypothetical protein IKF90_19010, partial [Parasporobacterium sp.]|nr:hypothetical protein [Parasporobacterium sp.]